VANVYNMPSGVPFLRSLAAGLSDHFGDRLGDGLILLPTRRATRALAKAFVQQAYEGGQGAALLPRLRPLADVNPDEPPFEPGELAGRVRPAIDPVQRRFEIAQLVSRYHERVSDLPLDPAAAVHMADPLISIMDDAALEEVRIQDQAEWANICEQSAIHFQDAGRLYQIIETYWPERLREIDVMEPNARRVALLDALAEVWAESPPDYPVIIAGSTGTLQATARLMRVVANMPDGMVVLPGLQEELPDAVWSRVDARHPQSSLKGLLSVMEVDRSAVRTWPWIVGARDVQRLKNRRKILAEALVPVDATGDWVGRIETLKASTKTNIFDEALEGLSLIEARTDAEEALTIALILREALETPGRTAALVTPDQLLAHRVRARLSRWDVDVGMSQGVPVAQMPVGIFLSALLDLVKDPDGPEELALVFNHPLCAIGFEKAEVKAKWRDIERRKYRGLRYKPRPGDDELIGLLHDQIAPLLDLGDRASPEVWATALISVAEAVARTDADLGAFRVWRGDDGQQAARCLEGIVRHGSSLPETDAEGFAKLLNSFLRGTIVRPTAATHPRLSILGPLEARLLDADVIILGGLNEGSWPAAADVGPFLSRGMREKLRLSLPERRYGLAAHDFAELAANSTVYLTRSLKDDSGPTVASRWVWRLKTLLRGTVKKKDDESDDAFLTRQNERLNALVGTGSQFLDWARALDLIDQPKAAERPNPTPPVAKRWARQGRKISITGVSKWIRDPYSIYGREVLRLQKLLALAAPHNARQFGTAMHAAIETYLKTTSEPGASQNQPALEAHFRDALSEAGYSEAEVFKENARIETLAQQLIDWFAARAASHYAVVGTEVDASAKLPDLDFELHGILDLVERSGTSYAFTDFKTGQSATGATVYAGFDLQLPLAAWLAEQGALDGLSAGPTSQLSYVRIKGSNDDFEQKFVSAPDYVPRRSKGQDEAREPKDAKALAEQAVAILRELVTRFDQIDTAYPSQPRAQYTQDYGEYDDLARRAEWMAAGPEADE
jgi:ATP-dependent helicase/nuclease subunit B